MTLDERINWINSQGWDWEMFETARDTIGVQAWPWEREMREWEYSKDGQTEISENSVIAY